MTTETDIEVELPIEEPELIENGDGSVDIPLLDETPPSSEDFLQNLAEEFPQSLLSQLGMELAESVERDKNSREKRDKQYEEGLRRTGLGDDAPGGAEFSGASRVVHPVLAEACVDFSSRAIKELFPASGPVKPWVLGDVTAEKLERANRKTRYMNWQLTTQISEYRAELEQLLTQLPMGGSQYQKFWRDDRLRRNRCEFVPIDEIFLPFAATDFYTAARVTHRQLLTRAEFRKRVKSGLYRDVFIPDHSGYPEESSTSRANDKIEGREEDGYNEDGLRAILEIYCWLEEEEDLLTKGAYAPYIVTIDEDTEKVLSVYRNWKEGDASFKKLEWFVEWKFIPWRGAYAIGLPHLIGGLSAALTGALRALLDSAHINNAATMLKLKSGRVVGQNTQVNVTQVCDIEGPAGIDDVRKLAMPMPFNPPSPVLHALMNDLYGLAKGVVATAEDKLGQVGDRTPVGTTMALIEQGSNTYSAIHARLHESQKMALAILHRLNSTYLSEEEIPTDLGEFEVYREDFTGTMDVVPVSDPTIFSEAQRFAQSQALLQMAQQDAQNPQIPWNQVNVRRRMLKQMRIEGIDELLPPEKKPVTADLATENAQSMKGVPIQASDDQDHWSHIQGHLLFLESPLQSANPLVPPQLCLSYLGHIEEHIRLLSARTVTELARRIADQNIGASEESILVLATQQAQSELMSQLGPILQRVQQLQQALQQRMPKPELPPEVQASLQIAQMDIQRKAQLDQATLQSKQSEQQAKMQMDHATHQMRAAQQAFDQQMAQLQQQFDQYIEQQRMSQESQIAQLTQRVEMMNNEADNRQKQMTELLKNRDDNETKVLIEEMKGHLTSMQETMTQKGGRETQPPDLTPQLHQMQQYLDQIGKQQTNDALTSVMDGLRATIETLNKPKMIIRDAQGKAQGIQ